jgi:hypothetical protein
VAVKKDKEVDWRNDPVFTEEEMEELNDRFDPCEHGRKLRCDACSSRDWTQGREDGFGLGFNWVIAEIEKRAGEAFIKRKDDQADSLRDLVKEIREHAKKEKVGVKDK